MDIESEQYPALDASQWVEDYGNTLFYFAIRRVRNEAVAEDLVQNTLMAGIRGKDKFAYRSSVKTWLLGILKNQIADYFRKESRYCLTDEVSVLDQAFAANYDDRGHWKSHSNDWEMNPEEAFEQSETQQILWDCINGLPERVRLLFVTREIDGLSTDEICETMDLSVSNMGVLMHRARHALRNCFISKGIQKI